MNDKDVDIAHLSDLHFGAASDAAVTALHDDLSKRQPERVIITGDLTQDGRKKEFEEARAFLSAIGAQTFIIPGNHDLPVRNLWARFVSPYNRFQTYIADAVDPVFRSDRLLLIGLNSARRAALDLNWSYGRLSRRQIDDAVRHLQNAGPAALKIVATHHPFIRGEGRAGARIVGRGAEAMKAFAGNGLDIILSGHVHNSRAELVSAGSGNIVVIQAGTATSLRTRGEPPSYNIVRGGASRIEVETIAFENGEFRATDTKCFSAHDAEGWKDGGI